MEEDRMSQLPDDILLLILDKIDTSQAVKTSILSTRWKNLRYLLPSLRLRFSLSGRCLHFKELRPKLLSLYQRVSQYLSHRDATATIHDFHLSFDLYLSFDLCDREYMEECVFYAINHGVQSLRLNCHTYRGLRLPAAFLTCETLRELELGQLCRPVEVPGRLSLPNLKSFHLETPLVFYDDDISMEPFSGLPELEKLTLIKYSWDGLVIKAPKLRVLEIIDFYKVKEISAPLLTSFRYESAMAWECTKVNLPKLEQVCLDIQGRKYCYNVNHTNFRSMLRQLRNATSVSLSLDLHYTDSPEESWIFKANSAKLDL
ncbi:hypothetical protein SASPL_127374 [Salvia splendens]|uniref:F-box domain-containing protein n=1 Tax=Salvia splendens TaxID=180675 RepID=A0A8X8XCY5_SALSN|nr:F-box/FBD/LRR-repeat protein At5g53840-like [Salvia splendens]KAG6409336.1 hypothetical protein SASPL_127374 [Salvia splendens]